AMTATAPASSAIFACSAVVTSMITPPFSIPASPVLTRSVPVSVSMRTSRSVLTRVPHEPAEGAAVPLVSARDQCTRGSLPRTLRQWDVRPVSGGRHGEVRGEQLDPRVPRIELDLLAALVQELRDAGERGPAPGHLDQPAVAEHVGLPGAGGPHLRRANPGHAGGRGEDNLAYLGHHG